ncbi:flagellar biosynthetic protein FliQ [Burkholderia ubonensis]|uniref:flagellar biosynthetic protein FliQ n=1 Tax=Burkholderia ubonensis TaxID=101571 RepID=UPI0007598741|nr:flagellar biosynthetic protein FliQ [Burkholderia ubonensis]KWB79401.1 flagellar biosynthetic protein FliQ [Burkholderia ubonensis]
MLTPDLAVEIISQALRMVMLLVVLIFLPGFVVGLLVSLFQSITQINEQTLSFLPRFFATLAVLIYAGHWIVSYLMHYCVEIFQRAATLVG